MNKKIYLGIFILSLVLLYYIFTGKNEGTENLEPPVTASATQESSQPIKGADTGGELVYITGAVEEPGLYEVSQGVTFGKVIELAGGLLPYADTRSINLAERVEGGEHIHVAFDFQGKPEELLRKKKASLNTADEKTLETLPGVGPAMAKRIVDYRKEKGGFSSIEQLKEVKGIGDAIFHKLEGEVTLS